MLRRLRDRRAQRSGRSTDAYSRYATVALHDVMRHRPDDLEPLDSPAERAYRAAIVEALAGGPDLDAPLVDRNGREWSMGGPGVAAGCGRDPRSDGLQGRAVLRAPCVGF